ncbi:efflux RND transporter periplasmic adaptor subunit [Paenibacillus motobuensis]|uniref:RND efflux pump membrane fusion protein barrel-sandwich domain-containing protein n=1 Tax=Paenibacillus motobuensis TaxID=295324 RepID=A0ABP3HWV1_9BACL
MKKKWLWIVIVIVILALIAVALSLTLPSKNNAAEPPQQRTTKVTKGNITVSVSGSGSVISTDSESVRTKDEGKVNKVLVKTGDVVKKGQTLLTYEAVDLSSNLEDQETNLQTQKWDLEDLQDQYKHKVQDGASEEELKQIQKSMDKQELNITKTEQDIATIKENMLPPDPLTSPIAGTITSVNITSGEQAKAGSELFVITDYQNLSVKTQVDELDIPEVKKGMKARLQLDALPDQTIEGTVSDISNEGSASNGVSLFDVTIKMNPTDGTRVGMTAEATIIVNEKEDILKLPIEAVQKLGEKYFVILPSTGTETESNIPAAADSANARRAGIQDKADVSAESGNSSKAAPENPEDLTDKQGSSGTTSNSRNGRRSMLGNTKEVEVGVHDENYIEIVSGLNEGDEVVIPTIMADSTDNTAREQFIQGGGAVRFGEGSFRSESGGMMPSGNFNGGGFTGSNRSSSGGSAPKGGGQ